MDNPMKVLVVEPMKAPYEREISGSLASMQEVVGGDISATYPFDDPIALIHNDLGKLEGLPPNRLLYDDNGVPYDMVCGTIFPCWAGRRKFCFPDLGAEPEIPAAFWTPHDPRHSQRSHQNKKEGEKLP